MGGTTKDLRIGLIPQMQGFFSRSERDQNDIFFPSHSS